MKDRRLTVVAVLSCNFLLLFCVLVVPPSVQGQNTANMTEKRIRFLKDSESRLAPKPYSSSLGQMRTKAALWQTTLSESDWLDVTDAVGMAAKDSGVKSAVTISTSGGNGAVVKYQTLGQRKRNETATTAKSLTELVESMYIGVYNIWSERDGKPTSDRDAQFQIANDKEKVMLQEKK